MLLNKFYNEIWSHFFTRKDAHLKTSIPVIAVDSRSGVSYEVSVGYVAKKESTDCAGILCDMEDGTEYLKLYLD